MSADHDVVIAGTGFASTFFLHELLRRDPNVRVLVLEKGALREHAQQFAKRSSPEVAAGYFANRTPEKPWWFTIGVGGGSNCWWACTPRLLPNDFRMQSAYGVGRDWPISYDELEPYYARAESLMSISGPADGSPFPRSTPYPLPPHRFTAPDEVLKAAYPDSFFIQPTARPPERLADGRPRCCANGVCNLCPIDSKFTILNSMRDVYAHSRVTLKTGASVQAVELEGGSARGLRYLRDGREEVARADLVALGTNAIFNAHILLRSGLRHRDLGCRVFEQAAVNADVYLDGLDNFGGSTSITGHGYMLYDGPHRSERPAVLLETHSIPRIRNERGKWLQWMRVKCVIDELPQDASRVTMDRGAPTVPAVSWSGWSDYAKRGAAGLEQALAHVLAPLPVEAIRVYPRFEQTEAHVLGTVVMGRDAKTSIVDGDLVHHSVRNLLVLGGSAFPTGSPANPTLTIAALSLRAAARLMSSGSQRWT